MDKKYKDSLDFLFQQLPMFSRTGAPAYKPGLETSLSLAAYYNNPHIKFKSIHIGGTNGKGSTSHLLASILQTQGYKVGLYTSPHLIDFRERIKINGEKIPEENVVDFVEKWKNYGYEGHPSFFELTMIMAFNWFAKEKVDYAVIEVGMGGRLDSTNIITPILSVITNISHDHNQFLGSTLKEIAGEKAGIIKPGIPVVIGETQQESKPVFIKKALETSSEISFADQEIEIKDFLGNKQGGWNFTFKNLDFFLPLAGDYQKKNILTVLKAIGVLKNLGININDTSIRDGINNVINQTGLMGRWTIHSHQPLTISDTGHNIAGITFNMNQLSQLMNKNEEGKLRIIIGFVADKAIDKIVKILPKEAQYYVTNAQIPRALPAQDLLDIFKANGLNGSKFDNVGEAYRNAQKEASDSDIIFIGGSTFIVADFLSELNN